MRRIALLIAAALAAITLLAPAPASAALPGQPNGIPTAAHSNQWRPAVGNLCFEDWTNNYAGYTAAAIQHAATQISSSSDWNVAYGGAAGCEANGYTNATKVTFVMNHTDPDPGGVHKDTALVTTEGGYRVGGYLATRMIVHLFSQDVDWYSHQGATNRLALMEAVRVLSFRDPDFDSARTDTVLWPYVQRVQLTPWDYDRLDQVAPW